MPRNMSEKANMLSAPTTAVRGELGQLPLHLWWKERILRYWDRLCSENLPILLKASTRLSVDMAHTGQCCWAQRIIAIFDNAGFSDSFFTINGCNKSVRKAIMCSYRDQFIQRWYSDLMRENSLDGEEGNKLRTYREFKVEFQLEQYLTNVTCNYHCVLQSLAYVLAAIVWK